ncbi:MAG: hypothetical protein JW878_00495 [Methanomicrobia archaeon]|nr:hypothetical protein [Methanomicrobia archaeon]
MGGSIAQAAAQSASISVSPSTVEASPGETFRIDISIDPHDLAISGAQFNLYFDQNVLNATSQTQGTFLAQDGATTTVITDTINNSLGRIEYAEIRLGAEHGVSDPGVFASITFEVVGTTGMSNLKLSNVILSNPDGESIETTINSGTCTVATSASDSDTSGSSSTSTPTVTYVDISAEEAQEMLAEDPEHVTVLDVRTAEEYNAEHIPGAKSIPLSELEGRIDELDRSEDIIIYSQSGIESRTASELLVDQGCENVYNLLGGIDAWRLTFPVIIPGTSPSPPVATPESDVTPSSESSSPPALSSSPAASLTSTAPPSSANSPSTPPSEQHEGIPGFGAPLALAAVGLAFALWRRRMR